MISTADFKRGLTIELEGEVFQIVEFQHVKPGKGGAFVRTKLRNIRSGNVFDRTFRAGERMEMAHVERKPMQYLYRVATDYVLMDLDTYDQITLGADEFGDGAKYLKEGLEVSVVMHNSRLIGVELPDTVELEIAETDPGLRGDTASGGSKPAKVETGAVVDVPLFINTGDVIRVDTRSGEYVARVST
ncbi:MAG: elongation factor P [Armatimonadota bacterium]|nr:MAG: elongation factor P [Armatimonadota bacterium]